MGCRAASNWLRSCCRTSPVYDPPHDLPGTFAGRGIGEVIARRPLRCHPCWCCPTPECHRIVSGRWLPGRGTDCMIGRRCACVSCLQRPSRRLGSSRSRTPRRPGRAPRRPALRPRVRHHRREHRLPAHHDDGHAVPDDGDPAYVGVVRELLRGDALVPGELRRTDERAVQRVSRPTAAPHAATTSTTCSTSWTAPG